MLLFSQLSCHPIGLFLKLDNFKAQATGIRSFGFTGKVLKTERCILHAAVQHFECRTLAVSLSVQVIIPDVMFFQLFLPIGHLGFSSLHCGICSGLFHECLFQRRLGLGQFACQVLYMGPVHDHVLFHVLQGAGCFFVLFLLAGLQFTTVLNRLFEPCYITADGIKLALHRIVCFAGNRLFLVG